MLTDSANNFNWLYLFLLLPAAIYYGIRIFDRLRQKNHTQSNTRTAQTGIEGLLKIKQRELSSHPPLILTIISLIGAFLLLAFGSVVLYTWIAGIIEPQIDPESIAFLVLIIGFPLYTLIDYFFIQPKYYKLGRSLVAKEAKIIVSNDADAVFDACYRVLGSMKATIRKAEKPRLLKANIRDSVITMKIRRIKDSKVQVYILSDSKWLTVKLDAGANQRNIDSFLQELGKQ